MLERQGRVTGTANEWPRLPWAGARRGNEATAAGRRGAQITNQGTEQSTPKRLYKAPTDYTKSWNTIQSPDRLYKAPKRIYKAFEY